MASTQIKSLARVDLNLLVVLDLLLKERHVSRVAQEMFVSQSAISRSLKRLREAFDDPLFTRTRQGLIPTTKALALEKELNLVLPTIIGLFNSGDFEAAQCDINFSMSIPPFISSILFPHLYEHLQLHAPKVSITEVSTKTNALQLLDANQLDFAFHYELSKSTKYRSTLLGHIYPVLYARKDHPLTCCNAVTLEKAMQYPFIGMHIEGDANKSFKSPINQIFQEFALTHQRPKLRASQTYTLLNILRKTDSILFGSNGLNALDGFDKEFVEILTLKEHSNYVLPVYLIYHIRNDNSPAHHWLANLLTKMTKEIL